MTGWKWALHALWFVFALFAFVVAAFALVDVICRPPMPVTLLP